MNPELTTLIERYLNGELTPLEKADFEQKIRSNESLRKEVELHQNIHRVAKRISLRADISQTGKRYHLIKKAIISGLVVLTIAIGSAVFYVINRSSESGKIEKTELQIELDKQKSIEHLESQYFEWKGNDTVFVSQKGVLLSVPKNAFLLNGAKYTGNLQLQYQEALDPESIVSSGLSTTSEGKTLETQGMFGIQAFTPEKQKLQVNPETGIYVQVPVEKQKDGMMLFEGKKLNNGTIDWLNPKALEKLPTAVAMSDLNFYPPGYEKTLNELKLRADKKYRDSLYLSLEEFFQTELGGIQIWVDEPLVDSIPSYQMDYSYSAENFQDHITPASVMGFWNAKFNNTNLATREFEQRMPYIHRTCNQQVLDLYTKNLDKSLSEIDRQVVEMGYPEFQQFANEHLSVIKPNNAHLKNLQQFYQESTKSLQKEYRELMKKRVEKEKSWDKSVNKEQQAENKRLSERSAKNFSEELELNTQSVYRQLGKKRPEFIAVTANTVGFTITGTANTYNIDRFVTDATSSRTSGTYTDPETKKTAQLTYAPFSIEVDNFKTYDRCYAYIFPNKLSSFVRLDHAKGKFSYSLNMDFVYDVAIVGFKGNEVSFYSKKFIKGEYMGNVSLKVVSQKKLSASLEQLNLSFGAKKSEITTEISWILKEQANYVVQKNRMEMQAFRVEIARIAFPCNHFDMAMPVQTMIAL